MPSREPDDRELHTSAGTFPLLEYRAALGGREWSILHTGAVLTVADEVRFLFDEENRRPYGVVLWPAAIALAHDLELRGATLAGSRLLELGAGTGLPGLLAASMGARVMQTDRQEVALAICRRNAARNAVADVALRAVEWEGCDLGERFDWIIGSDIAYAPAAHGALRRLFARHLAPGGRVLLADPFRGASLPLLQGLEEDGWAVTLSKWTVAVDGVPRAVGVYEAARD
ncbi:MAG: Methyltransferase6 [Gemmatimonadetes bacterium]|jgi:predicted nicotinamide N-methyase|nr:Methyltransferase6 [Gemmatimonadota bacterium]